MALRESDWTVVPIAARLNCVLELGAEMLVPDMTEVGNGEPLVSGVKSAFTAYMSLCPLMLIPVSLKSTALGSDESHEDCVSCTSTRIRVFLLR